VDKLLDWLEKYRVVMGGVIAVVIVGIGGLLIWYDRHPNTTTISTRTLVSQTTVPASGAEITTTSAKSNSSLININTANAEQLDSLPGIGATYAQRIIDYRVAHGNYKTTHDLVLVKGIGEGTYTKLKDLVTTGGE
jgi:comEA protein